MKVTITLPQGMLSVVGRVFRESDSPLAGAARSDESSDIGLDWYDRLLTQTFPASDALPLW